MRNLTVCFSKFISQFWSLSRACHHDHLYDRQTEIQMDTQKDKDRQTPAEATTNTLLTYSLLTPTPIGVAREACPSFSINLSTTLQAFGGRKWLTFQTNCPPII